jgi:hypothetical protein
LGALQAANAPIIATKKDCEKRFLLLMRSIFSLLSLAKQQAHFCSHAHSKLKQSS